jgi:hypothetical protein
MRDKKDAAKNKTRELLIAIGVLLAGASTAFATLDSGQLMAAAGAIGLVMASPTPDQSVAGVFPITALAFADGLVSLQFQLNNVDLGQPITAGACTIPWDTRAVPDGIYSLSAIGTDQAGVVSLTAPINVRVVNSQPLLASPGAIPSVGSVGSTRCSGADPFAVLGGGSCVNGNWLPPLMGLAPPTASSAQTPVASTGANCTTPDPFVSLGGGSCVNGNWLPPGMGASLPPPTASPIGSQPPVGGEPPIRAGGCTTPDPFTVLGGGTCINGNWLPPGSAGVSEVPVPSLPVPSLTEPREERPAERPPTTGGCTGPDPFVAIGGGWCVSGGWIPRLSVSGDLSGGSVIGCLGPDPFVTLPGLRGSCVNGAWVPVRR